MTVCGYCGSLDWTATLHGRVTHKQSCPVRVDPWCQAHPQGCPADCVALGVYRLRGSPRAHAALAIARKVIASHENMPTEQGVPLGWVDADALELARALVELLDPGP